MTDRRHWLTHPVQAWRAFAECIDTRADAAAIAGGLTIEHLPNGVRRYHDPRLDHLAELTAAGSWHAPTAPGSAEAGARSTPTLSGTGWPR